MSSTLILIGAVIAALLIGFFGGKVAFDAMLSQKKKDAEERLKQAQDEARKIVKEGEQKAQKIVDRTQKELDHKQKKIEKHEERLGQKEEKLDKRIEKLDEKKEEMMQKKQEMVKLVEKEKIELAEIAKLTPDQAKEELFDQIEEEHKEEIKRFVDKMKLIKEEESKEEASKIIAKVLPRVAQEGLSEHLTTMVDLPAEDMKGKIIGREGRNISTFEKVTGVEVTIDDTPETIKLSSYDPEKRFVGTETMKKLVKDGRINPVYIEKTYKKTRKEVDELFKKKGKETLTTLNIPMMKPELVEMVGRFHVRYSYGQNLLLHSIEVARMAEMLANELGLNADLAKKAGLLHDIGKIEAGNGEAHTKVGAEMLKKHKLNDCIVNTAEGHHFDVELRYPEARVATAADIISASRPGARFDNKELFNERMSNLENLVTSVEGVEKAYIMQAGREIMTFFNPQDIDDRELEKLTKKIGTKIEDQLDYPGAIRIVGIRENKTVHYLR